MPPVILRSDKIKVLSFKEDHKVPKSPPKPAIVSEKEVINWLNRFDQPTTTIPKQPNGSSPTKQRVLEQYMDRKKEDLEARHRLKLKEFD